jgi:predicted GNAT family N-acyltransferase
MSIREEVFMQEQGFKNEFDDIDDSATHIVLYDDGSPVGCCRVYPDEAVGEFIFGRLAVRKKYRGQDIGRKIMEKAIEYLSSIGASYISLSAQIQAKGFYANFGFMEEGEEYLDEHCPHIHMVKELGDR